MIVFARVLSGILVLAALAGCSDGGATLSAIGISAPGLAKDNYVDHSDAQLQRSGGTLTVITPSGEVYTGQQSTALLGTLGGGNTLLGNAAGTMTKYESASGKSEARLMGPDGRSMLCKFTFVDAAVGFDGGGEGRCKVAGGESHLVTF